MLSRIEDRAVIISFADKQLERCWQKGDCRVFDGDLWGTLQRKLDLLEVASNLADVQAPPGCAVDALRGKHKDMFTLHVDRGWYLVFRYTPAGFSDIRLKEYVSKRP